MHLFTQTHTCVNTHATYIHAYTNTSVLQFSLNESFWHETSKCQNRTIHLFKHKQMHIDMVAMQKHTCIHECPIYTLI